MGERGRTPVVRHKGSHHKGSRDQMATCYWPVVSTNRSRTSRDVALIRRTVRAPAKPVANSHWVM